MSAEQARVLLQRDLDSGRSSALRNRLGQFSTPTKLADDIVRESLRLTEPDAPIRFLDPAFGTGSFYSALLTATTRDSASAGFEIDDHYGNPSSEFWRASNLQLNVADFTKATPPPIENKFNLVICNPPYVRHHHISPHEKSRLQKVIREELGINVKGLTGLYCYFVLLAHRWMAPGAIASWLIPSEFMDVKYGHALKDYLLNSVTLLRIHRFDPNDVQFADALVSSAVVCFKNQLPDFSAPVEFSFGGSLVEPVRKCVISPSFLRKEAKWTRLLGQSGESAQVSPGVLRLGDLFTIKRGLATGDNKFFILSEQRVRELGLSNRFLRPILPSPRYIADDIVVGDESGAPAIEKRLYLIDCTISLDELEVTDAALARYLSSGGPTVAKGYLCSARTTWYSQEKRPPAPFLCTYMGRTDETGRKTFRFILNQSRATAANVYLMMYPKDVLASAIAAEPDLAVSLLHQLNKIPCDQMSGEGRTYGGGLHKLEPLELSNVPADNISSVLPESMRRRATQLGLAMG
ncbi:MAG TPA: Eco57I restriction-modification methylase domain-containing protein [Terriglobales bacterium]